MVRGLKLDTPYSIYIETIKIYHLIGGASLKNCSFKSLDYLYYEQKGKENEEITGFVACNLV